MTNISLLKKNIIDFIKRFEKENLPLIKGDLISARVDGNTILSTPVNSDLVNITEDNLVLIDINDAKFKDYSLYIEIYKAREDISALIHTHFKYSMLVSKARVKVPPVLDDMAQILGPSVQYSSDKTAANIIRAMKGRNACYIADNGTISTGRTVDEAHTGSLVLEKASKVFVEAEMLGGAVKINPIEANLMHFVYKKKYSKKDQEAKIADLKG